MCIAHNNQESQCAECNATASRPRSKRAAARTFKLIFESYSLHSKNWVDKGVDFYVQNAPKLNYEHLSVGYTPGPRLKGEGREGGRVASWLLGEGRPCKDVAYCYRCSEVCVYVCLTTRPLYTV